MKKHSRGKGPSTRQLRMGELVRRRLAEILMRGEVHDPELNAMSITVGEVRMSPDLRIATAYVQPLGGEGVEAAIEALARNRPAIRRLVGKDLRVKYPPDFRFRPDPIFDHLDHARALFSDEKLRRDVENGAPEEGHADEGNSDNGEN